MEMTTVKQLHHYMERGEIDKVAFGRFFLMISSATHDKYFKQALPNKRIAS